MKELIQAQLDKQFTEDWQKILNTPEGQRIYQWIQQFCGVDTVIFYGNNRDAFFAGQRSVALKIKGLVGVTGISGVVLRQKAEIDNIIQQEEIAEDIRHQQRGGK